MKFIFKYNGRSELYLYWTSLKQRWFSIYSTICTFKLFCFLRKNTKIILSLCNKAWMSTLLSIHVLWWHWHSPKYFAACCCSLQYIHTMLLLIFSMKNENCVDMIVPIFNRSTCWLFNWKDYGFKVNVWDKGENIEMHC